MAQADPLFVLIKALSKSEKRYFKLFAALQQGNKNFMGLFDIIRTDTDGVEVGEMFRRKFPGASFEAASKHLYKILMRSLKSFEDGKTIENKLMNLLAEVRILFKKGIHTLCFSEIERGKKLALQHEKYFLFLQFARLELQYFTALEFPDVDESRLVRLQEKINDILYFELFINKHASLYEVLSHRFVHQGVTRSEREQEKLNDLLLEEFQINANQHYDSFQSDKLHLHFQSTYFMMTGNPEQSLQEFYQLHKLFEDNTFHRDDDPVSYIYLLQGILTSLRWMGKYEDMKFFIDRLKHIPITAQNQQIFIQHLLCQGELAICIDQQKFAEALTLVNAYAKEVHRAHHAPANVFATTHLQISLVYFGLEDFHSALRYINIALNVGESSISHQVYGLCRLLSLIIHVELSNDEHLSYSLRSVERKLKTEKKFHLVEKVTIAFVRKWIQDKKANRMEILQHYHQALLPLREDKFENQFLKSFNFIDWAEVKMKRIS